MSDETLSQLVTEAIAANLSPLMKWLYGVFVTVVVGTSFVVGMVADVRSEIKEAKREASEARTLVDGLMKLVMLHDKQIGIYEDRSRKGGGE